MLTVVALIVVVALVFDFINGFHDAANSIATVVSTRVLSPMQAVAWAAFFNFIAAFGFGVSVATTVGKGVVESSVVDQAVVFAALMGAIVWNLITWYWGLPTSSSHALIGGFAGAAVIKAGIGSLIMGGLVKIGIFMILAPVIGLVAGFGVMLAILWIFRRAAPGRVQWLFRRLQLVSAAAYSLGHGTNDAQKTMGIIAVLLFTSGYLGRDFYVPVWVILSAHAAIALGTLAGGWRIVKTMGMRITKLRPVGGFSAETAGAITLIGHGHRGHPGQHHAHDHGRDHGSGLDSALLRRPLGRCRPDRVGLDLHDPGLSSDRRSRVAARERYRVMAMALTMTSVTSLIMVAPVRPAERRPPSPPSEPAPRASRRAARRPRRSRQRRKSGPR